MRIWSVSREYAGLAEAGGVKNVARSLCVTLTELGHKVRLFIPLYGCSDISRVGNYREDCAPAAEITVMGRRERVRFDSGIIDGVKVVFIRHPGFLCKRAVYVYTDDDERENPAHRKGVGHEDAQFLNVLFQKAMVVYGARRWKKAPDIIHCHDATCAMIPAFIQAVDVLQSKINGLARTRCLVTIHNAGPGYHHDFASVDEAERCTGLPRALLEKGLSGRRVEPFLLAAGCGAELSTVSPRYAEELRERQNDALTDGLAREFIARGIHVTGITNGIDALSYDPTDSSKSLLPFEYNPLAKNFSGKFLLREYFESVQSRAASGDLACGVPVEGTGMVQYGCLAPASEKEMPVYFAYHGRMVHQKGVDILCAAAQIVLERCQSARFVIVGQGAPELEQAAVRLASRYAGRCVYFNGYDRAFCRLCTAACDFMVLPSNFEPCGLEDLIASCLGTVPVAHATGGLTKIIHGQTGFLYRPNTPQTLAALLLQLADKEHSVPRSFYNVVQAAADYAHTEFSWRRTAEKYYVPLFRRMCRSL